MPLAIVLAPDAASAAGLARALQAAGWGVQVAADGADLVRQLGAGTVDAAPQQVVLCGDASPTSPLWRPLLRAWAGAPPCPVSLFAAPPAPADGEAWLAQGLAGWWPADLRDGAPAILAAALALDAARWRQATALRADASRARGQLDERKWVDRAKGVLMSARGIGEDEAFRLLRGASMHANLRVGDVSRSVIAAAQWAEAVNRAGQLRMLSQRLVKLAAQRLAGIDVRHARSQQDEAAQRAQDNLDHLATLPLTGPDADAVQAALATTHAAWAALLRALAPTRATGWASAKAPLADLARADQRADAALAAAEALTDTLEAGGARRALRIVNVCGRQRMRVQRLAKQALLASLQATPECEPRQSALAPLAEAFEAALRELETAPLSSADIRDKLAAARAEWQRLQAGLPRSDSRDGRAALAHSSDALQALFDQLTAAYEHSLQVIMS